MQKLVLLADVLELSRKLHEAECASYDANDEYFETHEFDIVEATQRSEAYMDEARKKFAEEYGDDVLDAADHVDLLDDRLRDIVRRKDNGDYRSPAEFEVERIIYHLLGIGSALSDESEFDNVNHNVCSFLAEEYAHDVVNAELDKLSKPSNSSASSLIKECFAKVAADKTAQPIV